MKQTTMRFDQALCGAAIALALIAGCKREEPKPTTAPAAPSTPQPAERPPTEAPQVGTPPGGTDARRTVGQVVDDATINAKIKAALLQAPDVKGTDVNVDTVNGTVTLKGAVESQAQVDRAVQIARAAEGVKAVSNQLTLKTKP